MWYCATAIKVLDDGAVNELHVVKHVTSSAPWCNEVRGLLQSFFFHHKIKHKTKQNII